VATGNGVIMGTPEYMAPEQVSGAANVDARTDIWAIGAVLYKALTGVEPFRGQGAVAVLLAITGDDPEPVESHVRTLPAGLAGVIYRCLAKRPDDRYQSARALSEALLAFESPRKLAVKRTAKDGLIPHALLPTDMPPTLPVGTVAAPELPPAPAPPRRSRGFVLAGSLAVGGAAVWWWMSTRGGAPVEEVVAAAPHEVAPVPASAAVPAPAVVIADPPAPPPTTSVPVGSAPAPVVADGPALAPVGPGAAIADPQPAPATPEPAPATPEPAPATPVPAPALIVASGYVSPAVAGEPGTQHWAKEYCEALGKNKFLGVGSWKLANPREARLFTGVSGLTAAAYWTSANYRGKGLVVSLPDGNDHSLAASTKSPRPLCVARRR
jgi:serine/threonine-protein kinase